MPQTIAAVTAMLANGLLLGCSSGSGDASQARCERTFARMAPTPEAKTEVCSCIIAELEARGMSIMDAFGNEEGKQIARQCAERAGLPVTG